MENKSIEVIFFDVRGTLGEVDRPGHLVPYRPTTERLLTDIHQVVGLRIAVISNLPANVSSEEGRKMLDDAGITPYLDEKGIIFNHDAGIDKPHPDIFRFAAEKMGVAPEECLFSGENLLEVIGAQAAGMQGVLKPAPPGREFDLKPVRTEPATPTSSGRVFEQLLEEEHLLGKRIVMCAAEIAKRIEANNPPLTAMGVLVYLTLYFVDPFHHRKEDEALLPLALARGLPPEKAAFVALEHEQGRTYFRGMDYALRRIRSGDNTALVDFSHCLAGFIALYRNHGAKEDNLLFPEAGKYLTAADDVLIISLMRQIGPQDITPYISLVQSMEDELGVVPS